MSGDLSKSAKNLITTFVFRTLQLILGNDIFSRLSLGIIRDFRNVTINLATETGIAENVIGKVLGIFKESLEGTKNEEKDDLWYWALLKTLRADMKAEKLYPPGRV